MYAGLLEHTDHHMGRLIDTLADLHLLDEMLIVVLIRDNGASAEESFQGCFNVTVALTGEGHLETIDFLRVKIDLLGRPKAYNHYAVCWAHPMNTPDSWTKQVATHWRGTRNGLVVHWPQGITARGELRGKYHHVIDLAPTLLELAGLPEPTPVTGVQQLLMEGISMAYSFNGAAAAERRHTQYFKMFGNRGIYHKVWTAVTRHRLPWETGLVQLAPFDDDTGELYDTTND